ncbi:MAG: peptide chain release factor N(5)-glutamine methyltransferase [Firmicutes bacterium]|nr:peptide chain release factor N(5)-glutamine methyltransferase [Bacillota bacterium]MDY5531553.1 peptide chain release factor N(5)-glutamine methyltransferase [Pumilibacteraceae bacterium]
MKKEKKEKKKVCRIGGQALIEGVMMQGAASIALSVRSPDGKIVTEAKRRKGSGVWGKIPLIRGMISFIASLITGTQCIMKSSRQAFPEEETPSAGMTVLSGLIGVVIAIAAFMLLPGFLADLIRQWLGLNVLLKSLIEGLIRITLFVLYLLLISRMKDIRRTFMYHGAEHRTINCYEHGMEVEVENVQTCSTRHNRCGTTFLFFVMVVSILLFALVNWLVELILGYDPGKWVLMGVRLACLPFVAGISYELLRFLALLPDNKFVDIFRAPGLGLQRLTTYPPEDEMAEVAITAFEAVLKMDADPTYPEREFGEYLVCETLDELYKKFDRAGIDRADADWIAVYFTNVKRSELKSCRKKIDKATYLNICDAADKRIKGVPLDYILGETEFYGMKIKVTEDVLIPRPETELLCEQAIGYIGEKKLGVLDLCTGSGCIAAVIASKTDAVVTAVDVDEKALSVARENCRGLNVECVRADMFENLFGRKFDVIISNPPYIRSGDLGSLQKEVQSEPILALDGGEDGLKFYREIAEKSPGFLNENGVIMLEIGFDQAEAVTALLAADFTDIRVQKDLEGNDRMVIARKKN